MRLPKYILVLLPVFFLTQITHAQEVTQIQERATILLEECIDFKEMVGISAAISYGGKVLWKDAQGHIDLASNQSADPDMINRIASISKPMTAVAILQLMEKGKLKLDDPVIKHLPSFPQKYKDISIFHLLNHSSGMKAYKTTAEAFPTKNYNTLLEAMEVFQNRPLANEPGEAYNYTTYGYVVLGAVIEASSGQSYRDYMMDNIWKPAGMEMTDVEIFGRQYDNKSKLYRARNSELIEDTNTNLSVKVPGGGIQSTAKDLLLFGQALIDHRLLSKETFEMMIEDTGIKKAGNPYGLGCFIYGKKDDEFGRIIGHSGSQSGTSTQFMIYLDHQVVVSVLSNTSNSWNRVFPLSMELAELVLDPSKLDLPVRKAIPLNAIQVDEFSGIYKSEDEEDLEIYRLEDRLFAKLGDAPQMRLHAFSETGFFLREQNITFEFDGSKYSAISSLLMNNKGERKKFNKINTKRSLARALYNKMKEDDWKKGLKWFDEVRNSGQYDLDPVSLRSTAHNLINVGEILPALEVLKKNHVCFPNDKNVVDAESMISIASQLINYGETKLATEYLLLNQRVFPDRAESHIELGKAYLASGKNGKASKSLKEAIALDPSNEEARLLLKEAQ